MQDDFCTLCKRETNQFNVAILTKTHTKYVLKRKTGAGEMAQPPVPMMNALSEN